MGSFGHWLLQIMEPVLSTSVTGKCEARVAFIDARDVFVQILDAELLLKYWLKDATGFIQ